MGYTHYFEDATATAEVRKDADKIIKATTVVLAGPDGTGAPVVSAAKGIMLNGSAERGEDYESFIVPADTAPALNFCKTHGDMPYDEVVTAILVSVFVHETGEISSDGTFEEWAEGIALFERAVRPLTEAERTDLRDLLDGEED